MMDFNKRKILFFLTIFLMFIFSSCALSNEDKNTGGSGIISENDSITDKGPVRGGTVKLFSTIPDTLNPIYTKNIYVKNFSMLIYEPMIQLDRNQKCIPILADKWTISDDKLTWTFHIRENALWHDGTPVTAADAEFTFQAIMNTNLSSIYKTNIQNIASFSATDKNTFVVILKQADSFTAESMTFPILPKHYFEGEDMAITPKNISPLGTGSYKFVSYTNQNEIRLVRNDKWWNTHNKQEKLPDLPYTDEVVVKIYGSSSEGVKKFQTRDIDVLTLDYGNWSKYSARSDLSLQKYPSKNFEYISLNLKNSILWSKAVRQAIAYSINIDDIITQSLGGNAIASDIPIIPDTWLNKSGVVAHEYNIDNAKKILRNDGWEEIEGVMCKKNYGTVKQLKLQLLVNEDNEVRVEVANKISNNLKEAGIIVEVKKVSWEEEMKEISHKWYDMAFMGVKVKSIPDISFMYSSDGGFNTAGYNNQNVDDYLSQIKSQRDDDIKDNLFKDVKEIIADEVPYLGLYFYDNAVIYNNRIRGEIDPDVWNIYNDISKWYLP